MVNKQVDLSSALSCLLYKLCHLGLFMLKPLDARNAIDARAQTNTLTDIVTYRLNMPRAATAVQLVFIPFFQLVSPLSVQAEPPE